jgi:hypothetical protein
VKNISLSLFGIGSLTGTSGDNTMLDPITMIIIMLAKDFVYGFMAGLGFWIAKRIIDK